MDPPFCVSCRSWHNGPFSLKPRFGLPSVPQSWPHCYTLAAGLRVYVAGAYFTDGFDANARGAGAIRELVCSADAWHLARTCITHEGKNT
eukprot:9153075-Pyramimonas_sp.AAC.1